MTRVRLISSVVAACGSLFLAVSVAHARTVGTSTTPLVTDSARYGLYVPADGKLTLVDFDHHVRLTQRVPAGCSPVDGARSVFLVTCPAGRGSKPFVYIARSRKLIPSAGDYNVASENFFQIGRYWLAGSNHESTHPVVEYRNWHTGQTVTYGEVTGMDRVVPRDLNSRNLRPLGPATGEPGTVFATRSGLVGIADKPLKNRGLRETVYLRHASHRRVIAHCVGRCSHLTAGDGLITWTDAARYARAYSLRSRRLKSWRLSADVAFTHSAGRVFFSIPIEHTTTESGGVIVSRYKIRSLAAPR